MINNTTLYKSIKNNQHKSQQIFSTSIPQIQRYDTNKIFEQFKNHLLKTQKKKKSKNFAIDNAYKDLLCMVRKNNVEKKQKLEKITYKYQAIKKSCNTFILQNTLLKKKDFAYLSTHQDNFVAQKQPEQFLQSAVNQSNIKYDTKNSQCKFKAIRPMTTEKSSKKFRINTAASGSRSRMFESSSHNRLISQVSRLISPGAKSQQKLYSTYIQKKSQTTIILQQNHAQKSLPEISQSIMMVELQQCKLKEEISSLSQSMNKLTKQLAEVKKQLQVQQRNQQKYKYISNLATSIKNETQYTKLQNQKGFTRMLTRQDETIADLKKFKMNLRKQKDDMENAFIDGINQFFKFQQEKNANKNKQLLFMMGNENDQLTKSYQQSQQKLKKSSKGMKFQLLTKYNNTNGTNRTKYSGQQSPKQTVSNTKLMKKLIDELDNIIQLFQQKQPSFQSIKQQQCTRVRLCKINKSLLPKQRVQILQKIQEFQTKYDMKIVSVENLMLRVYHLLYGENQKLQADCLKLTQAKEETNEELKKIVKKHGMELDEQIKEDKLLIIQLAQEKKLNSHIKHNSMIFVKIIEGFYNILFKYRYMFSLALTLDVDRKLFRDTVIQIDSLFKSGLMAGFCADKFCSGGNEKYDILSQHWFAEALREKLIDKTISNQLTQIMFNDYRIGFMVKKTWIESYLNKLSSNSDQNQYEILNIIDTFHNDCSQIYQQKLPNLSSLFLSCFKSLHMTKYESKLAASSVQRGQIFLPNRPVKKLCDPEFIDHINDSTDKQQQDSQMRNSKKKITFISESSANKQDALQKNPAKIIFNLESIKNRSQKKFKALNFSSSGKTYKYNDSIIIPNFHMIDKCEDF